MRRCLLVLTAAVVTMSAYAQSVAIRVEAIDETDREYEKAKTSKKQASTPDIKEITQTRRLQITLSNRTSQNLAGLTLKYFFFARGVDDKEVHVNKAGKRDVSLAPSASKTIPTDEATTTYSPAHAKRTKESGMTRTEQIPATGDKNEGYGVQVFNGKTLLAEAFNPPELKKYVGLADNAQDTPPSKKAKKKSD